MVQALVNIQRFFMLAVAQLPMLYSDSLLCFCSLLVFKLAEFLLRPIGLYLGNTGISREIFRASPLRCALVYRHNDIIVLITGEQNMGLKKEKLEECLGPAICYYVARFQRGT